MTIDDFLERWRLVAGAWADLRATAPASANLLLRELLEVGLEEMELPAGARPASDAATLRCEIAVVRAGGLVDVAGYLAANPGVASSGIDPVGHFCRQGWQLLYNPSLAFDTWWYWSEHLQPQDGRLNPGLHFLLSGRHRQLAALPTAVVQPPPDRLGPGTRRACLFAGYDADGIVDDYVVAYVAELARHADVYYLADCTMGEDELRKLASYTKGAWARPHGRYDFGSWSVLADDLVGWSRLEQYDEVLFVNDASYLLRSLDDVFAKMEATRCDWWGLQLTDRHFDGEPEGRAIPVDQAIARMPRSVWHYDRYPHVGSYFLAMRRRVMQDPGFRKRLSHVARQDRKIMIVYKYETGTTFHLYGSGYRFATYVDELLPYHPAYSSATFDLIAQGFPVVKRALLAENPYDVPDMHRWKERLREVAPGAPVDMLERNLLRVSAHDKLQRSFSITTDEHGKVHKPVLLTEDQMAREDANTPTFAHWWAFPVCAYDHTFAGNERAVFEQVKDDPSIKKIILTRSRPVSVTGQNVVTVPLESPEGQWHVVRSGQIFVKHAPRVNVPYPLSPERHNFIDLWHGIPLKRFGWAAHGTPQQRQNLGRHHEACRAVITSSKIDRLAMTAAFHPLAFQEAWPTGLPRSDFILRATELLPPDLRAAEERLRQEVGDRRLVMFLPTFKDGQEDAYYAFSDAEISHLADWCKRHDAVIGLREHMADRAHTYARMLAPLDPINLSSRRYADLEVLYRVADALVTDYSSCIVDFLLTGRPVISFAYDFERFANEERGLFYDLDQVIPGPICRDFEHLASGLEGLFDARTPEQQAHYEWCRKIFFDHVDDQNAARVVARVKALSQAFPPAGIEADADGDDLVTTG